MALSLMILYHPSTDKDGECYTRTGSEAGIADVLGQVKYKGQPLFIFGGNNPGNGASTEMYFDKCAENGGWGS
jgi:hypothetical protein